MTDAKKLEFLKTILPGRILQNINLPDDQVVSVNVTTPEHLDGFMSTIHRLLFTAKNKQSGKTTDYNLMVKVIKGDDSFRTSSRATVQFNNERILYTRVVPRFKQLLQEHKSAVDADEWCPRVLYGVSGKFPEYSDQQETILVMENMTLDGFKAGPRNDLDEAHLILMAKKIAQFHACSYAMKIINKSEYDKLVDELIPLNFVTKEEVFESYALLFKLGVGRVVEYVEDHPNVLDSESFKKDFVAFKTKYGTEPIHLMQKFMKKDDYTIILHGDYNRNNVLFKYDDQDKPIDVRMFDFQEHRMGSPAIDLAFFMCMSMPTGLRERFWDPLLKHYHDSLMETLTDILKCSTDDPRLKPYTYKNFIKHLDYNSLYGGMVAMHFLPWMLAPDEECAQLAHHFATDMYSKEMKHWTKVSGGEPVDLRLIEILRYLSKRGSFAIVHADD
ncbi:uncharacterized protein LOC129754334 [Uranotaenia lowii]|uniref:uncharacterized protein LOC129754334 n=1 Tax=Uranotaenia lowii TaxID=190385 RepID=UPI0024784192|nr:uncharacterized protein LOC129754334 [Uranotaenia lowii]